MPHDGLVISPSHEELVYAALPQPLSWRHLPQVSMSFGHCYREELRPKNGLLRSREFLLLDGYAVSADEKQHRSAYSRIRSSISGLLHSLGVGHLTAFFATADEEELSEEFVVIAESIGEKRLLSCGCGKRYRYPQFQSCACGGESSVDKAIEFADIIRCGTTLAQKLGISFMGRDGKMLPPRLISFGLGVSKLIGAMIEAERGRFFWPDAITPYHIAVIPAKGCEDEAERLGRSLSDEFNWSVLLDDRDLSIGRRVKEMQSLALSRSVVLRNQSPCFELADCASEAARYFNGRTELLSALSEKGVRYVH